MAHRWILPLEGPSQIFGVLEAGIFRVGFFDLLLGQKRYFCLKVGIGIFLIALFSCLLFGKLRLLNIFLRVILSCRFLCFADFHRTCSGYCWPKSGVGYSALCKIRIGFWLNS